MTEKVRDIQNNERILPGGFVDLYGPNGEKAEIVSLHKSNSGVHTLTICPIPKYAHELFPDEFSHTEDAEFEIIPPKLLDNDKKD